MNKRLVELKDELYKRIYYIKIAIRRIIYWITKDKDKDWANNKMKQIKSNSYLTNFVLLALSPPSKLDFVMQRLCLYHDSSGNEWWARLWWIWVSQSWSGGILPTSSRVR